jgi:hypothetical protein
MRAPNYASPNNATKDLKTMRSITSCRVLSTQTPAPRTLFDYATTKFVRPRVVRKVALLAAIACAVAFATSSPTTPANAQETWVVGPNASLRAQLEDWADRAGWTLVWNEPNYDVVLKSGVALSGSFEEAITTLMESSPVVTATTYRGNKTVVITVKGSSEK